MIRVARALVPMVILTCLIVGCGGGTPLRLFVLGPAPSMRSDTGSEAGLPILEMSRVTIPDYLDSTDILRRTGPNEVLASPTGRWGERLSLGIEDALTGDLSARVGGIIVTTLPMRASTRRLVVDIEKFEVEPDGRCVVAARWWLAETDGKTAPVPERGEVEVSAIGTDDAGVAAALTKALAELADQMAVTVRRGMAV